MNDLAAVFSSRSPNEKAMFLAQVAHEATLIARNAYIPDEQHPNRSSDNPDPIILREGVEFVHRVAGYTMHVLDSTEMEGQDASVIEMIVDHFTRHRLQKHLYKWLGLSHAGSSSIS